jgi:uncharacterized membrane protein
MNGNAEEDFDKENPHTVGERIAEFVATVVGSWFFIVVQSLAILAWVWFNADGIAKFDPYPFILLNLVLSLQAGYTAPMILMAQNRQNRRDRMVLYGDYEIVRASYERMQRLEQKLDAILLEEIRKRSDSPHE